MNGGSSETPRTLLEFRKRIDIEQTTSNGDTALVLLMNSSPIPFDLVKILINAGANLNQKNSLGYPPIALAAFEDNQELARFLLKQKDINVHVASKYGAAINLATTNGHLKMLKLLMQNGADVNQNVEDSGTPLYCACKVWDGDSESSFKMVDYLASNSADHDTSCGPLGSLMHVAATYAFPGLVRLLQKHDFSSGIPDDMGRLPIHLAISDMETFAAIRQSVNVKVYDNLKRTTLHWAARHGEIDVVEYLLAAQPEALSQGDLDG